MANGEPLVNVKDYEKYARNVLPKVAYDYYASGAGDEFSLSLNKSAFSK